jgi:hypothetical protein
MNANELADELENITTYKEAEHDVFSDKEKLTEAATMLRQQQAEIKDLKQQVAFLEDWRDTWSPFLKAITGKVNDERK